MENHRKPARRAARGQTRSSDAQTSTGMDPRSDSHYELPVLPVRNTVLLPHMVVPLFADREPAQRAIEAAMSADQRILVVSQRTEQTSDPTSQDIYLTGTECTISRFLRMPDNTSSVLVQGMQRARITSWVQHVPYGRVTVQSLPDQPSSDPKTEALGRIALGFFETCTKMSQELTEDAYVQALNIESPGMLADFITAQIEPPVDVRQEILETVDIDERLRKVCEVLKRELSVLELEHRIRDEVHQEADRGQRELLLREQLQAIQRELGEADPTVQDTEELRRQIEASGMPQAVETRALREVSRLANLPSLSPEYGVLRSYLDWLVSVPWNATTPDRLDLAAVTASLDARHFGLEKVKDRIVEYIAVRKLSPEGHAPILCFVGPPGVGKTTLGRSIAEALGRRFVRISLGGVHDEAEIRGHRRTYVGALPGRIVQAMKTAGTINPVIVLDEIDKLGSDFRGDPAAALLEVLDPEQNATFSDHYLEVPYDLSHVLFVVTANVLHTIPAPLRDRMEIIELAGYSEEEKAHIAMQFLVPKQRREAGLTPSRIEIDERALRRIIREYTFEAGVRGLEREIGAIMRRVARRVAEGRRHKAIITSSRIPAYLGPQKHFPSEAETCDEIGVATGLAWTPAGGDLTTVEVMAVPGHGNITLTGQLGDVMKESAQAALTYTRARADLLGLPPLFYEERDIHVHLPAGGIPKDGPSAGATMAVAIISALMEWPVRKDVAMTGEITLRGRVLPVGGIKEKVLAAYRAGITTIVMPRRNLSDLEDVHPEIRDRLTFVPVDTMDDVLPVALRGFTGRHAVEPAVAAASGPLSRSTRPLIVSPTPVSVPGRVAHPRPRARGASVSVE